MSRPLVTTCDHKLRTTTVTTRLNNNSLSLLLNATAMQMLKYDTAYHALHPLDEAKFQIDLSSR